MLYAMHLYIQIIMLLEDRQKKNQGKYFRAQKYAVRPFEQKVMVI